MPPARHGLARNPPRFTGYAQAVRSTSHGLPWLFYCPFPFQRPLESAAMPLNDYPIDSLMYITNRPDIVFTHGKGSWLYDHTGKRYLDFIQGWAVNSLGHCNDGVVEALKTQAEKLLNPSPAFYNEPMAKLAGLLTQHSV